MRFRLKTDFLTYARDQIRGGIWYKVRRVRATARHEVRRGTPALLSPAISRPQPQPAWWDAVRKVPPTAFVPRVKKADIPRITFVEDRLIR